ncbi:restriction endonuclease subunit S [Mycoplasmoides gallisepticum]|uniref:restriction endonuclease subunit S n=1 Tax=Mycoplasmoides gallisepticum TaxID=2096 RepID=UPI00334CE5B2
MGLTKLGNYIEQTDIRNYDLKFGEEDVKGISTTKQFIDTKADLLRVSLKSYKVIGQNEFVYVADTSRRGDKIGLAYCENKPCIVSSIYTSFRIKEESKLLPRFLMMFFNRSEFDRYARFNSWGSARETFTWEDMCNIELDLPPIEIQKKICCYLWGLIS